MKLNNIRKCNAGRKSTAALTFACLSGLTVLGLTACSDNELDSTNVGQDGTAVRFQVTTADKQAQQAAKANPNFAMTRAGYAEQLQTQGLTPEDLATRKIEIPGNSKYCLIESTVAGIDDDFTNDNAVATRAKITTTATLGKFSAIAYRGSSATGISTTPWFYNAEVNANGTLATTQLWSWSEPYARFYAVYPQVTTSYSKLTLSPASNTSTPYVNIEVEPGVQDQKDLMTACTGTTPIHYNTLGTAPAVPLQFQHAMTAIRFKIGDRLSGTHKITKIEIVGAKSKGKFTLPSSVQATTGASFNSAWSDVSTPATFTLDGINVSTAGHVNETIVGKDNDNFTFYMIPQTLSSDVKVKVYFDNQASPAIVAPFAGTWKAGTTKTYALSQSANNLKYTFEATPNPSEAANTEGATTSYQITSYVDDDKQHRPVKWKVVSYDADGDGTFSMSEKPDWLTIPNEGRTTTQDVEQYTATFNANQRDVLADFNNAMKTADPVTNYNLANATGADAIENTANCYVISAPGTYRIPLVYGNAIEGGITNASAYTSTAPVTHLPKPGGGYYPEDLILHTFVDHNDDPITSPYINIQNASDQATSAKVIWEDCQDIVTAPAVTGSGADSYLTFTIKKENLQNGNAVVAVTNAAGNKVMWSWHLWFTPKSSLKKIAVTSDGSEYKFMTDNLGWKYTKWTGGLKREVVVKIEQQAETGEKKTATITLKQAPGNNVREGYGNLYQWGRKDPLPGINTTGFAFDNNYVEIPKDKGDEPANVIKMKTRTIGRSIQNPGIMLPKVGGGKLGWHYQQIINMWSANNNKLDGSVRNNVKTIYDPSPVGFKVPDAHAFMGFSTTGAVWSNGYTFKVDNDKEIYFQAGGARYGTSGALTANGTVGFYWQSVPKPDGAGSLGFGYRTSMKDGTIATINSPATDDLGSYANGYGVRPVAE